MTARHWFGLTVRLSVYPAVGTPVVRSVTDAALEQMDVAPEPVEGQARRFLVVGAGGLVGLGLARAGEAVRDRADHDDEQRHRDQRLDQRVAGLLESTPNAGGLRTITLKDRLRAWDFNPHSGDETGTTSGQVRRPTGPIELFMETHMVSCGCSTHARQLMQSECGQSLVLAMIVMSALDDLDRRARSPTLRATKPSSAATANLRVPSTSPRRA